MPITIHFHGIINEGRETVGMFISDDIMVTQFQANNASLVFPCFEEPSVRSTFEISITAPIFKKALSNMPVKSSRVRRNLRVSNFETTPAIPVYLVCFIIGSFDSIHS